MKKDKLYKGRVVYEIYQKDDKGRIRKDRPFMKATDVFVHAKNYIDADSKIRDEIHNSNPGPVLIISVKDVREIEL